MRASLRQGSRHESQSSRFGVGEELSAPSQPWKAHFPSSEKLRASCSIPKNEDVIKHTQGQATIRIQISPCRRKEKKQSEAHEKMCVNDVGRKCKKHKRSEISANRTIKSASLAFECRAEFFLLCFLIS